MVWSSSELAAIAGTTVGDIRHYHQVGLLDAPDRAPNGYKQYRKRHLRRLVELERLRGLGVPIAAIAAAEAAGRSPEELVRAG